jgi:hypothetical protein
MKCDSWVDREARRLAGRGQLDRPLDRQVPGVAKVEVGDLAREQVSVGKPGAFVLRREARDRQRRLGRRAQRAWREVRAARVAPVLPEVDRHADALVAVVLDRLDLAAPDGDGLSQALRDLGLRRRGSERGRVREHVGDDLPQRGVGQGKPALRHRCPGGRPAKKRLS